MTLTLRDNLRHTYGDYITWSGDERYELIDGIAYAMSPAPTRLHQRFVAEIFRQIADALEESPCEVNIAPFDVRLPANDEDDESTSTVIQPDIVVVCDPDKLDERGCRGAPDWIIEILSPATAVHDQINKLAIYQRHGVQEYWLIHPADRIATVYLPDGTGYGKPQLFELRGTLSSQKPAVTIDWQQILAHIE